MTTSRLSFENRHSLGGRALPAFGGDSSSATTSTQKTDNYYSDSRSVIGIDDHSVTSILTDSGNTTTGLYDAFNTKNTTSLADSLNTDNSTSLTGSLNTHTNNYSDSRTTLSDSLNTDNSRTTKNNDSFNTAIRDSQNSFVTHNVSTTDAGAVRAGADISIAAIKQNSLDFNSVLGVAGNLFARTKETTDANLTLAASLSGTAQKAYSDASDQASGNKSLIMVAIVAVGAVAFFALKK